MVACLLSGVLFTVLLETRERVRESVREKLDAGRRMLSELEARRSEELRRALATLGESPTLKAAIDTYQAEFAFSGPTAHGQLLTTVSRELEKLADSLGPDVIAALDASGRTLAVAGRRRDDWPTSVRRPAGRPDAGVSWVRLPAGIFRLATGELVVNGTVLGTLEIATALDAAYVQELSALSDTAALVASDDRVFASTLPEASMRDLAPHMVRQLGRLDTIALAGTEYGVRELARDGTSGVYMLESVDAAAAPAIGRAARGLLVIALAAFVLAGLASVWLARTIARPIGTLSRSIAEMTWSRTHDQPIPHTGVSLEIDTLTSAFNSLIQSVTAAEAETRSAYVGAIRALAAALDARDPYTAGHSERVSAISVAIGRQMGLPDEEVDILRLGALLHDIGKIGISDAVLRKPSPLSDEEYEVIKTHPAVGARILRSVPFLAPHIPIVELHHEQPDGQGYPLGLAGDEIPLAARVVHVADAFDAMTRARAYRPGRPAPEALGELWRHAGSQFDVAVVQALATALSALDIPDRTGDVLPVRVPRLALVTSPARATS
jgi:putative nucleotidyltransferase with HDIG domain